MRKAHPAPILLLVLVAASSLFAADAVKVNKAPPAIEHKKFNRDHPPADMPPLEPGEAAVTKSIFGIATETAIQVVSEQHRNGNKVAKVKIAEVTLNLTLGITVWLPNDAPRTIIDHEEGHRQLNEYFYKDAEKIAREIGQKYVGQTYEAQGADVEAAGKAAVEKAINEISQKYMAQTQNLSARANEIYDELTNHSRNQNISVEKAMKQSIERAKKEKEKK
jgi:hypothetical protein